MNDIQAVAFNAWKEARGVGYPLEEYDLSDAFAGGYKAGALAEYESVTEQATAKLKAMEQALWDLTKERDIWFNAYHATTEGEMGYWN